VRRVGIRVAQHGNDLSHGGEGRYRSGNLEFFAVKVNTFLLGIRWNMLTR
jgi:hypothetical protein